MLSRTFLLSTHFSQVHNPGVDSSCLSEFSVHVLGHNLGNIRAFTATTLQEGVQSTRKYTKCHARIQGNTPDFMLEYFIYCTLLIDTMIRFTDTNNAAEIPL